LDKAGTRKQVTEAGGGTIIWGYDNLYHLTSETRGSAVTQFHYDAAGNRDWIKVNGVQTNYNYNALDQLTSAGSITYNADQLTNVTATGVNATYVYDADGRRVKQTLGSTVTNYLWDEASTYGDVVYEYNGSGTALASYVLGGNQLISQTRGSTTNYFLQDGQGSTRALTSSSGTVTDTYSYNAFGDL
jgi:YD repeat-containing protein